MRLAIVKQHPHLGATYDIFESGGRFLVEVRIPGAFPTTISGFATRDDAGRWIEQHQACIAKGPPPRRAFNSRPKA